MIALTERQLKILAYMKKEISTKGYPPTVREVCNALGIKSTSTAHKDIDNLVQHGFLIKDPAKPRALMVVEPKSSSYLAKTQLIDNATAVPSADIVEIPLVGRVAAGTPIFAEENIEDTILIPSRYAIGTNFLLRVRGESMIEAGIMDGDLILVQKTERANNGEIVVAMIDDFESEATVKTFYNEGEYIRLQPENSTMSPITVKDVKILGRVKGVFRYFH
jgi:repressor LexA